LNGLSACVPFGSATMVLVGITASTIAGDWIAVA
jgi:hypothetical protein